MVRSIRVLDCGSDLLRVDVHHGISCGERGIRARTVMRLMCLCTASLWSYFAVHTSHHICIGSSADLALCGEGYPMLVQHEKRDCWRTSEHKIWTMFIATYLTIYDCTIVIAMQYTNTHSIILFTAYHSQTACTILEAFEECKADLRSRHRGLGPSISDDRWQLNVLMQASPKAYPRCGTRSSRIAQNSDVLGELAV